MPYYPVSIEDEYVMLFWAPFDIIAFISEKKCWNSWSEANAVFDASKMAHNQLLYKKKT